MDVELKEKTKSFHIKHGFEQCVICKSQRRTSELMNVRERDPLRDAATTGKACKNVDYCLATARGSFDANGSPV